MSTGNQTDHTKCARKLLGSERWDALQAIMDHATLLAAKHPGDPDARAIERNALILAGPVVPERHRKPPKHIADPVNPPQTPLAEKVTPDTASYLLQRPPTPTATPPQQT